MPGADIRAIFTSDSESAMLSCFNGLRCACHRLQTVLKDTFVHKDSGVSAHIPTIFVSASDLVTYFRKCGQAAVLPSILQSAIDVRWNSHLSMLESILRNRSEIEAFLHSQHDEERIALLEQLSQGATRGTSWDYVLALVSWGCSRAIDLLQIRDRPTLHLVSYFKSQLPQKHNDIKFAPAATKHNMRAVIAKLKANISNKFVPDFIHEVAYLLHPLSKVVAADQDGVRAATLAHMGNMAAAFPNLLHQETEAGLDEVAMEGVRLPSFISFAPRTSTGDGEEKLSTKEMLESCLFPNNEDKDTYVYFDILGYWKSRASKFPLLAKLASFVLAIPASSAECECSFSTARFIKSVLCSALSSDSLEGNVVLHDNPDLLEKYFGEIEESDTELFKVIT
ncbi:Tam3-transposase (Ac family) [Plasmopara halstedii]|uniref:Tam3-transposase (Ac family) n=1 Tax=Plasmopara halstedii TaxID=4781 RepID=A0A0P1AUD6_PLAHL|nr:Tam3-transposase (Ac family) [Plasmopara halstedii]CEG45029.1 Tam3-transposase (Ac family) [Plasmopara halstedii]|eukprot:XP_024581398.1 Tam3-transposase (Ac family) [Plasmopara halstedii]